MTSQRIFRGASSVALALSMIFSASPALAQIGTGTSGTVNNGVTGLTGNGTTVGGTNATSGSTGLTGTTFNSTATTNSTTTSTDGTGVTPGLPNTGTGGDAALVWSVLAASLIVFLGGSALLARRIVR